MVPNALITAQRAGGFSLLSYPLSNLPPESIMITWPSNKSGSTDLPSERQRDGGGQGGVGESEDDGDVPHLVRI
jgi:hypothetical protein